VADLKETRPQLKIALAAMALVDVIALAVYFSPLIGLQSTRQAQLAELWQVLQQKTREVAPLRGLDKKIPLAHKQIDDFYRERLPQESSAVSEDLGKLAAENGVRIGSLKYSIKDPENKDPENVGLRRLEIEADLGGNYLQLVRFINSVERDRLFFLVDSVQLGGEQAGIVKLQMKVETYLRTGVA
jgi:type IV pilus assembly protein PilO